MVGIAVFKIPVFMYLKQMEQNLHPKCNQTWEQLPREAVGSASLEVVNWGRP